jgi:hypothetical protein
VKIIEHVEFPLELDLSAFVVKPIRVPGAPCSRHSPTRDRCAIRLSEAACLNVVNRATCISLFDVGSFTRCLALAFTPVALAVAITSRT